MRSSWWLGWDTTCVLELGPPWHTDRTAGAENHQWLQASFVQTEGAELGPPWRTDRTAGAESHQQLQACFVQTEGAGCSCRSQGRAGLDSGHLSRAAPCPLTLWLACEACRAGCISLRELCQEPSGEGQVSLTPPVGLTL